MIVSVVIAALLVMRGNITHKYFTLKEMMQTNQYSSFLLATQSKYGFEKSNIDMKRLVDGFELESDLRRKLSAMKVKLDYEVLDVIDTNEFGDEEPDATGGGIVFEIGKSIMNTEKFSSHLIRVKIQ